MLRRAFLKTVGAALLALIVPKSESQHKWAIVRNGVSGNRWDHMQYDKLHSIIKVRR